MTEPLSTAEIEAFVEGCTVPRAGFPDEAATRIRERRALAPDSPASWPARVAHVQETFSEYTPGTPERGFHRSTNNLVMNGGAPCENRHTGVALTGRFGYRTVDGQEVEAGTGEAYGCPPDHDKWTVGDEPGVPLKTAVVAP